MIDITFNGEHLDIASIEQFGQALDRFDQAANFEVWLATSAGPSMCMLRNQSNAWLMYLRNAEDSGFTSLGDSSRSGLASYTLGNGQIDEYPLAWCIDVEQGYKALAYFFANEGARPEWVVWHES